MRKAAFKSIKTELGFKFGSVVGFLLIMGIVIIILFSTYFNKMEKVQESRLELAINSLEIRANFDEMIRALKTMIIKVNNPEVVASQIKLYDKKLKEAEKYKKLVGLTLNHEKSDLSEETLQYYQEFVSEMNRFTEAYKIALPILKAGDGKGAAKAMKGQGFVADVPLTKFVQTVKYIAEFEKEEATDKVKLLIKIAFFGMAVIAILSLFMGISFTSKVGSMVSQIVFLRKAADIISTGKQHAPLVHDSDNELGHLTESFERMRVSMEKAMEKLLGKKK
ncbi:MAG: hypothetical protein K8S23_11195 [Candidatus Cloacimonetes bacterium]|nr:hypothetical protein [Candidatus Cloacimonadota bacterium]